jgi:hypothetical protein
MKIKRKGFSIFELLLVSAIIPALSLAIYALFSSGIKIYQRINRSLPFEEINFFLDNFKQDLKNTFYFKEIAFQGEPQKLSLATFVYDISFQEKLPGKVVYVYEPYKKSFIRQEFSYPQIFSATSHPRVKALKNIDNLEFKYYYYKKETNEFLWEENALDGKIPLAVRIEFVFKDEKEENPFVCTVSIPIATP